MRRIPSLYNKVFQKRVSKPRMLLNKKEQTDDVHARRLQQYMLFDEENQQEAPPQFQFKERDLQTLDLDKLSRVDFDNPEKVHIVPSLIDPLNVIFEKPGIYPIEQFKFHPNYDHLRTIPTDAKIESFDTYVPPSKDATLKELAQQLQLRYIVSTSTFSSMLSQIYYVISGFKSPNFDGIFSKNPEEPRKYMISQRKPISCFLHRLDEDLYALDGDSGIFEIEIFELMNTGKIVERQVTQLAEEFRKRYVEVDPSIEPIPDFHRFMKLNNELCLRSQIDCRTQDMTKVFEIKARSACPIRYDYPNYLDYLDYEIHQYQGLHSSYEREYYDLIRGAFLKWAFQLKIGRMDGAFIAYHNIKEIQGFEYVKASEIYRRVFGTEEFSDAALLIGSKIATTLFDEVRQSINEEYQALKIGVYAQSFTRKLVIFVEIMKEKKEIVQEMRNEGLQDEFDYYNKHPLTNRVLKYEMLLQPSLNDVPYHYPIEFRKGDVLGVKYKIRCLGEPDFGDYMNFLHDCYKHEEINIDINYSGGWIKNI